MLNVGNLFRSIGISNFGVAELEILLASAKVKPVANQVRTFSDSEHNISASSMHILLIHGTHACTRTNMNHPFNGQQFSSISQDPFPSVRLRATGPDPGSGKKGWYCNRGLQLAHVRLYGSLEGTH